MREREERENAKTPEEETEDWRRRLEKAYSAIRRTQTTAERLVLGHQHMYGELRRAPQIRLLQIFKRDCGLNSESVFVDLGCGLGKMVYLASVCGVQKSIGIEVVPEHLATARNSMERLKAENVELIEGDIKDNLRKIGKVTHLYAFDILFSKKTMSVIYAFLRKHKGIYFASSQKPTEMFKQRLNVQVLEKITGDMARVKESHICYIYKIV